MMAIALFVCPLSRLCGIARQTQTDTEDFASATFGDKNNVATQNSCVRARTGYRNVWSACDYGFFPIVRVRLTFILNKLSYSMTLVL